MPGLIRRKSSRGHRLDHSDNSPPHHSHGTSPYPTKIQDRRKASATASSPSRSTNDCLPTLLSNPTVSLAKIQRVKQELIDPMLPSAWSTQSASASGSHHSGPPPKKGKHPRRPPEAQMHHFPRKSCNECHDHKVKCVKVVGRPCERCDALGIECIFSLPKKYGRPSKGSSAASDPMLQLESGSRRHPPQPRVKIQPSLSDSLLNLSEPATASTPSTESDSDALSPNPVFASAPTSLPGDNALNASIGFSTDQHTNNFALHQAPVNNSLFAQGPLSQRVIAQSPPPIGQQSFRNLRERAESVTSDAHSFSSHSSSSNSLQLSQARGGDGSQLYFDALSPAHSTPEQSGSFTNSPIVATSAFGFSDLPWQQTAVTAGSWSRDSVSSSDIPAVPATTAQSLAPWLNGQSSIELDTLLNSFDATMFTSGGPDLGITAEMGLGLLPESTAPQPTMTSQAYHERDPSDTSLTHPLSRSTTQQAFNGGRKDSSPETPAASRSSLTSGIIPGSNIRPPAMNVAWQNQWAIDANQQQQPRLVSTSQPTDAGLSNGNLSLGGLGLSPRTRHQTLSGPLADLSVQSLGLSMDMTPLMMLQGGSAQQQQYLQSTQQSVLLQPQQQHLQPRAQHSYPFVNGVSSHFGSTMQQSGNSALDRPALQPASRATSAPSVIATDDFSSQQQQQSQAAPSLAHPSPVGMSIREQELERLRQQWRSTYSTMFPNQQN